jgi:hypothetical protein
MFVLPILLLCKKNKMIQPTFVLGKDWSSVYARDDYIFSVI